MDLKRKLIFKSLLGFTLGMLICVGIFVAFGAEIDNVGNLAFLTELIGSGIYGMICVGGTIVYELEDWGVTKATFVHYIVCFMAFFVANELLNWFPYEILFWVFITMTVIYFIIWAIEYIVAKVQVAQMNKELENMMVKKTPESGTGDAL